MKIVREEIFGPVAVVVKFNNEKGEVYVLIFNTTMLTVLLRFRGGRVGK